MKIKRVFAAFMSAVMLITLLAACANEPDPPQEPLGQVEEQSEQGGQRGQTEETEGEDYKEEENTQEELPIDDYTYPQTEAPNIDFGEVFKAFPADTIMFTVGDFDVTWEILYFRIHIVVMSLRANMGGIPDLSGITPNGATYAEIIKDIAIQATRQLRVGEYVARELGVQVSEEDLELLELTVQENIAAMGGENAFLEHIWDIYGIRSIELYRNLLMLESLPSAIFSFKFGEMGSALSDEDVALHFENDGFIMAKHILRSRSSETPETALIEIEEIYRQLREYRGYDFESFFDELMHEYTEDPGIMSFPGGYVFKAGEMVQPFYEAAVALEIGAMSGIVETTHGYHIILRIPIDYDAIPGSDSISLRARAAFDKFDAVMTQYMEELPITFTAELESLNLAELFEPCVLF